RAARGERALRRARRPRRGEGARGRPPARAVRSRRDARPLGGDRVSYTRADGRKLTALRPITIETAVSKFAEGSARISFGDTQVLCLATLQESVPKHLEGKGTGWVTAEYAMLPRSTPERSQRESIAGRPGGRTFEIQRLVGRALRAAVDLKSLGPRSVIVDCEVIQADGGTRTAAITGGFVALAHALRKMKPSPIARHVAPVSAGFIGGELPLDLAYAEGSIAAADVTVVAENAEAKARAYARSSGLLTVADDSGLEVFALRSAPGVRSRRFFGEDASAEERNAKLLVLLDGVMDRRARFVCVTALCRPDGA